MKSAVEILEARGWKETDTGCWELNGTRFSNGYGQIKVAGVPRGAHRVAYEVWVGVIPPDNVVRHKCDNKPCVNPKHLEVGTVQQNVDDRGLRNRTARGIKGRGVLTDEQVYAIRTSSLPLEELAALYNMSESGMWKVRTGRRYQHLNP